MSSSELEEWTLDDEFLAAMEAREDKELGFDEMNDETFCGELEEWRLEEWRGPNREPRMCRCAVDALKLKERCKRFRRLRFAEDVIINESERKEMAVTMEEETTGGCEVVAICYVDEDVAHEAFAVVVG